MLKTKVAVLYDGGMACIERCWQTGAGPVLAQASGMDGDVGGAEGEDGDDMNNKNPSIPSKATNS